MLISGCLKGTWRTVGNTKVLEVTASAEGKRPATHPNTMMSECRWDQLAHEPV